MASIDFNNVYLGKSYSIVGPYEKEGLIKKYNNSINDFYYNNSSFEKCEIKMQKEVIDNLLNKDKVDIVVGGDLANQITATTYNMRDYNISYLGVYGACATFAESLIILANFISPSIKKGIAITSSHNLTSERQFRYPIEYGGIKPNRSTFTATGAVGVVVSNEKSKIMIKRATIGKVIDYEITDANYLGAAMAPACANVILEHLHDFNLKNDYYDLVLTGDLGNSGLKLAKELLNEQGIILKNIMDAGTMIYSKEQDLYDGASGPVALPLVLFNNIIHKTKYKKILIVATGAMHSVTMVNQKESIPGIAYAVSLEVK